MNTFLLGTALFLLANIGLGMIRIVRGPSAADRMLTAQLFGTTGIAMLALLSAAVPAALDVALILALLAVLTAAAFVQRLWSGTREDSGWPR